MLDKPMSLLGFVGHLAMYALRNGSPIKDEPVENAIPQNVAQHILVNLFGGSIPIGTTAEQRGGVN